MKYFISVLALLFCVSTHSFGQRVGLVLSGGGAKGLAHVGVMKALEENEIPIDYLVGTSMGGIISGCYAVGMSPEQIEHMVLSDDFLQWVNGGNEKGHNYFYYQNDVNPNFLKLNLSLDSILNLQFNTSIASDVALNFAMAEKTALASAIARNNFDSLFVPLRVVAADIFTQNEVILKEGSLSDALRATQTVPFFYNPIRVDGKYLFDGGVYNNFPVDVAQKEFKPDVIIGVNVSTKVYNEYPYDSDEKLIAKSLLFLLLDKSDPSRIPENGVYIQPNLDGFTSFDFNRAKSLIDSGYYQTLRQIDEIKSKIANRVSCDDVTARRNQFSNRNVPMSFNELRLVGFNAKQRSYINRIFKYNPKNPKPFYYGQARKGYFRMVAENYFSNVYPNIFYDTTSNNFLLQLSRRPQNNFQVDFGGVIASRDVSNIFLGLNFYNFSKQLLHAYGAFQTGNFYKSASIKARLDYPWSFYLEPEIGYDNWDFLEGDDLLSENRKATVLKRTSRRFLLNIGMPVGNHFKTVLSAGYINNFDRYANRNIFVSTDTLDELHIRGFKAEWNFSSNNLNRKQYASTGHAYNFGIQFFNVIEDFVPGTTSLQQESAKIRHQWFRAKMSIQQYANAGWFRPGYIVEAVFSNQPFFQNYTGTVINAPGFSPLQDTPSLLLQNFRAFNYVAGGVRNVFTLRNKVDFRLEGYIFKPIEYLRDNGFQEASQVVDFGRAYFAGSAGFVAHTPIGPISLSLNYYDDEENQLGALLHVGFLLFNRHSMD